LEDRRQGAGDGGGGQVKGSEIEQQPRHLGVILPLSGPGIPQPSKYNTHRRNRTMPSTVRIETTVARQPNRSRRTGASRRGPRRSDRRLAGKAPEGFHAGVPAIVAGWPARLSDVGRIRTAHAGGKRLVGALIVPTSGLVYVEANPVIYSVESFLPFFPSSGPTNVKPVARNGASGSSLSPANGRSFGSWAAAAAGVMPRARIRSK